MSRRDLEFIHRGEGFSVACMPEEDKPSLVLSAQLIGHLATVCHAAAARLHSFPDGSGVDSVKELCTVVGSVLQKYEKESIAWWSRQDLSDNLDEAKKNLEAARKLLEGGSFDPSDGPRRA